MEVFLPVRIFAVRLVITFHYNGMRAKPFGGIHGHGGVHAEFPGLIITGSDYAAVTTATNQDRFTNQFGVDQAFHRYKKTIEVEMGDVAGGEGHGSKLLNSLVIRLYLSLKR